jgi:hypothetical protein
MIEIQLIIDGELMKSEYIGTGAMEIQRKHFQWVQLYGLNKIPREWEIVLNVPSKMGDGQPVKFPTKMFPYLQKIKNQKNESDQTSESESEPERGHGNCGQCHFEWRSFQIIRDATR